MRRSFPRLYKVAADGSILEWKIWVEASAAGATVLTRYGPLAGKKHTVREEVVAWQRGMSPYASACARALARWERQCALGYGKCLRGVTSTRAEEPMLAVPYHKEMRRIDWSTAVAQPRLAGVRCLVRFVEGRALAFSADGRVLCVPHVTEALGPAGCKEGVLALDGVLCHPDLDVAALANLVSGPQRHPLPGEMERVCYHACDFVSPKGFLARHADLRRLLGSRCPGASRCVRLAELVKVRSHQELLVAQSYFLAAGHTGAMLRHGAAGYEGGRRSPYLLQLVPVHDRAFPVEDYKLGRGRHAGVPVFVCATDEGNYFDVLAPGRSLEEKMAFAEQAAGYVGRSLRVRFSEYVDTADGTVPFQPVSVGFVS